MGVIMQLIYAAKKPNPFQFSIFAAKFLNFATQRHARKVVQDRLCKSAAEGARPLRPPSLRNSQQLQIFLPLLLAGIRDSTYFRQVGEKNRHH
jgi:hypothetical protein